MFWSMTLGKALMPPKKAQDHKHNRLVEWVTDINEKGSKPGPSEAGPPSGSSNGKSSIG